MDQPTSVPAPAATVQALPQLAPTGNTIYFNGFAMALTMGDVTIPISRNGHQFATLNVSYSVAKTLGLALIDVIERLEKITGNHIMTAQEIEKSIEKLHE